MPRFPLLAFAATGLVVAGCYGAANLPGASAAHSPARTVALSSAGLSPCAGRTAQPLNSTWNIKVDGRERTFVVHVPPSYDPAKATPLVLNFHGYQMSPKLEDWLTRMSEKSDAAGFVVVYPQGVGARTSFNAGICCGVAAHDNVDDVAFTSAMLDRLEADLCIDTRRVYATGMSNGGFMSHRLGCALADRIAAIAPVAGINGDPLCSPSRPVPVLDFHGTDDPTVPYDGDPKRGWLSAPASVEAWAARDGCDGERVESSPGTHVRCVTRPHCRAGAEVTLCTVEGGGHTWPGGVNVPWIAGQGSTNQDVSANDLIWDFFQKHPLPERASP